MTSPDRHKVDRFNNTIAFIRENTVPNENASNEIYPGARLSLVRRCVRVPRTVSRITEESSIEDRRKGSRRRQLSPPQNNTVVVTRLWVSERQAGGMHRTIESCASAVNDYRARHNITDEIIDVDGRGAYWRKSR